MYSEYYFYPSPASLTLSLPITSIICKSLVMQISWWHQLGTSSRFYFSYWGDGDTKKYLQFSVHNQSQLQVHVPGASSFERFRDTGQYKLSREQTTEQLELTCLGSHAQWEHWEHEGTVRVTHAAKWFSHTAPQQQRTSTTATQRIVTTQDSFPGKTQQST